MRLEVGELGPALSVFWDQAEARGWPEALICGYDDRGLWVWRPGVLEPPPEVAREQAGWWARLQMWTTDHSIPTCSGDRARADVYGMLGRPGGVVGFAQSLRGQLTACDYEDIGPGDTLELLWPE